MCSDSYLISIFSLFFLHHPYIPSFLIQRFFLFSSIIRVVKDMYRKANCIFHTFCSADPHILCFLFKSSLYGCVLWSLSSSSLKILQIPINKILRKIWHSLHLSHTSIVLSVAKIDFIRNIVYNRFLKLCHILYMLSNIYFVKCIASDFSQHTFSFFGSNSLYGPSYKYFGALLLLSP